MLQQRNFEQLDLKFSEKKCNEVQLNVELRRWASSAGTRVEREGGGVRCGGRDQGVGKKNRLTAKGFMSLTQLNPEPGVQKGDA